MLFVAIIVCSKCYVSVHVHLISCNYLLLLLLFRIILFENMGKVYFDRCQKKLFGIVSSGLSQDAGMLATNSAKKCKWEKTWLLLRMSKHNLTIPNLWLLISCFMGCIVHIPVFGTEITPSHHLLYSTSSLMGWCIKCLRKYSTFPIYSLR